MGAIWRKRGLLRGVLRRVFYWLLVPLFCLFTLANIVLNSGWVKGRVADALELRTGEVWSVGTLTFSPFGRLHIYDLRSDLGEGFLKVDHISVLPNYGAILKKEMRLSAVHIMDQRFW